MYRANIKNPIDAQDKIPSKENKIRLPKKSKTLIDNKKG